MTTFLSAASFLFSLWFSWIRTTSFENYSSSAGWPSLASRLSYWVYGISVDFKGTDRYSWCSLSKSSFYWFSNSRSSLLGVDRRFSSSLISSMSGMGDFAYWTMEVKPMECVCLCDLLKWPINGWSLRVFCEHELPDVLD